MERRVPIPIKLAEFLAHDGRFPAVYFLYNRGEVVYVGQSKTLCLRIDRHILDGIKVFDAISFIRCDARKLLELEGQFIRELAPKYNACALSAKVRERESWRLIRNRRDAHRDEWSPGDPVVNAEDCFVAECDLGEFLMVSDKDAAELVSGSADRSLMGLFLFMAANHKAVSQAQERYAALV